MLPNNIALAVRNISKKYSSQKKAFFSKKEEQGFWALKNISFEVEKGKVLGIIGGNGAGKSTLLKILSDIIPPTSGHVEYCGNILSILEIGTGFHQDLSGYENIFFNASLLGKKKEETELVINNIIEFSGIADFIHEPVKSYSSGMYLRLAFSIALFIEYDIILLDEVVAVGDAEFRLKASEKLKQKVQEGKTCIVISHDLQSIVQLCDNCVILEKGEIKFNGTAKAAVDKYIDNVNDTVLHKDKSINEHEKCRFISASLSLNTYYTDEGIELKIKYEKKTDEGIDIVLKIKNFNAYVLSDCAIYRSDYKEKKLSPGIYETNCHIPANLFNTGTYFIDLLFGDKNAVLLNIASAAKFRVRVREWEQNKKWNEEDDAIPFRPVCEWQTINVKETRAISVFEES